MTGTLGHVAGAGLAPEGMVQYRLVATPEFQLDATFADKFADKSCILADNFIK